MNKHEIKSFITDTKTSYLSNDQFSNIQRGDINKSIEETLKHIKFYDNSRKIITAFVRYETMSHVFVFIGKIYTRKLYHNHTSKGLVILI